MFAVFFRGEWSLKKKKSLAHNYHANGKCVSKCVGINTANTCESSFQSNSRCCKFLSKYFGVSILLLSV